jgi:hypothetical protein
MNYQYFYGLKFYQYTYGTMKGWFKFLTFFYIIIPLILVPYIANKSGSGYYLFGIGFYYIGVILVAIKQRIILMIPLIFCCWYWYTYGFSINNYVFFFLSCILGGTFLYQLTKGAERFAHRTLPESKEALAYDMKIEEMNEKLQEFKQMNPTVKITPEIVESIRNEVFFK